MSVQQLTPLRNVVTELCDIAHSRRGNSNVKMGTGAGVGKGQLMRLQNGKSTSRPTDVLDRWMLWLQDENFGGVLRSEEARSYHKALYVALGLNLVKDACRFLPGEWPPALVQAIQAQFSARYDAKTLRMDLAFAELEKADR